MNRRERIERRVKAGAIRTIRNAFRDGEPVTTLRYFRFISCMWYGMNPVFDFITFDTKARFFRVEYLLSWGKGKTERKELLFKLPQYNRKP